jgi:hypothetical protein
MNYRIRELAEQAGFNPYNYQGSNSELFEKFAELIVRECAQLVDDHDPTGIIEGIVLQHFGVE